jgi:zinc transport system permease protein
MAGLGVIVGGIAVAGGLAASLQWDTPAGPSIVAAASLLFFASFAMPHRQAG